MNIKTKLFQFISNFLSILKFKLLVWFISLFYLAILASLFYLAYYAYFLLENYIFLTKYNNFNADYNIALLDKYPILEEHSTLIPAHKYKSICKLHNIKHYTDFLFPTINLDISVLHNILEHRPDLASKFAFTIKQEIINENNFLAKKLTEEIIHKFASKFLSIIVILAIFGDLGYWETSTQLVLQ